MSFVKGTRPNRMQKASKRVLIGETREEEAARLEREIAAHPVTRCEPGKSSPSISRPGWNNKPFIPVSDRIVAEGIAKKMMRKGKGTPDFRPFTKEAADGRPRCVSAQ